MQPQPPANHTLELQREIDTLRERLRRLHADAEHNQQVLARFQNRELALLGAGRLSELLDRLTSGVLVLARTSKAASRLSIQFGGPGKSKKVSTKAQKL